MRGMTYLIMHNRILSINNIFKNDFLIFLIHVYTVHQAIQTPFAPYNTSFATLMKFPIRNVITDKNTKMLMNYFWINY